MPQTARLIMMATLLLAGAMAHATPPQELAKKHLCVSCHHADKKLMGPSYKEIAARYRSKGAEAALVDKVRQGGSGVWGAVPMPPNANISEEDAQTLVRWVLTH